MSETFGEAIRAAEARATGVQPLPPQTPVQTFPWQPQGTQSQARPAFEPPLLPGPQSQTRPAFEPQALPGPQWERRPQYETSLPPRSEATVAGQMGTSSLPYPQLQPYPTRPLDLNPNQQPQPYPTRPPELNPYPQAYPTRPPEVSPLTYQTRPMDGWRVGYQDPRQGPAGWGEFPQSLQPPMEGTGPSSPQFVLFSSPVVKIIEWALIRALLKNYQTGTQLPSPTENAFTAKDERIQRFHLSTLALAGKVDEYVNKGVTHLGSYIGVQLFNPFLETFGEVYIRSYQKTPVTPTCGELIVDQVFSQNIHQLHSLFSAIHPIFFPPTFTYTNLPMQCAVYFGQAFMKSLFSQLFHFVEMGTLENEELFKMLGENTQELESLNVAVFMQDRMPTQSFLKVAAITSALVKVLRKTAISCYNDIARIYPCLHNNIRFQSGLEALYQRGAY